MGMKISAIIFLCVCVVVVGGGHKKLNFNVVFMEIVMHNPMRFQGDTHAGFKAILPDIALYSSTQFQGGSYEHYVI